MEVGSKEVRGKKVRRKEVGSYEGPSKSYVTLAFSWNLHTCTIFMYDASLKRAISFGHSGVLHNDNHTFLHCAK